jgi:hypothetical protein
VSTAGDTPRKPASEIGEELVVRSGRIALIVAAAMRDVAREVGALAIVVHRARTRGPAPSAVIEAEATDESR